MSFLNKIADVLYRNRSNAWKAASATAVFTFVMAVIGSVLMLFSSVQDWIGSGDSEALLEDLKVQAKVTLSASVALFAGLGNYIYRWAQSKFSVIPGSGPVYGELPPPPPPAD